MITAQDIREKTFEKARMGGYDMASVDEFLEELADELTAAQKENAVLNSKMKFLAEKINEYRSNEEAINSAVLSAQKLAVQIENEARARADATIADADRQAQETIGSISAKADSEEKRLAAAKKVSAKYFEDMKKLCEGQLANMAKVSGAFVTAKEEPAPAAPAVENYSIDETVRSIENSVAGSQPEPSFNLDISADDAFPAAKPAFGFDSTQPFSF